MTGKPDILYFSSVEWQLFQRPQSLCLEFARRGYRVFYVEPMLSAGNVLKHLVELRSLKLPDPRRDNIVLLRPYLSLSTFRFGATQALDRLIFRRWFDETSRRHRIKEEAVVFTCLPYWWKNIIDRDLFPKGRIIHDCVDDIRVQARNATMLARMEQAERDLTMDADLCFTTAGELYNKVKPLNRNTYMLPNAIDPGFFAANSTAPPGDVVNLKRPVIGFVGSLYDHIDFGVFDKAAEAVATGTIALVGMTNRKNELDALLARHQNIVYLGPKPYMEVPAYMKAFDVCLNPFHMDEIGNSVNPLKLYEYLYFGKPVVSSGTTEMKKYGEYVYLYRDHRELVAALQLAVAEDPGDPKRQYRSRFAAENSWQSRVSEVERLLGLPG